MEERKIKIKGFLSRFFDSDKLTNEQDIFALGFVNSLLAMRLVSFIEKEYGVTIDDQDLDFANFRTINSMDALIERKKCAAPA